MNFNFNTVQSFGRKRGDIIVFSFRRVNWIELKLMNICTYLQTWTEFSSTPFELTLHSECYPNIWFYIIFTFDIWEISKKFLQWKVLMLKSGQFRTHICDWKKEDKQILKEVAFRLPIQILDYAYFSSNTSQNHVPTW